MDKQQERMLPHPVIDFTLPPRLVPTTAASESPYYSPFTNTLSTNNNTPSRRGSSSSSNSNNNNNNKDVESAALRSTRIDSSESNKSVIIGSLTAASGQGEEGVIDDRPSSSSVLIKETTEQDEQQKSQSMFELNTSNHSGGSINVKTTVAAATVGSSSRRSSQNSASENLTSHGGHHSSGLHHSNHQKTATKPPTGSQNYQNQQQQQQQQQQQNVQQLQTEISIKDELLKNQTVQLVETHRRQAELEEQLAFFKIDAKFDSVANFLLNPPSNHGMLQSSASSSSIQNTQQQQQQLSADNNLNQRNAHSPLPPAPYIGRSPFKVVLSADPATFRRDTSSLADASSVRGNNNNMVDEDLQQQQQQPLIIGLSQDFANSLRQLQGEVSRVATECQLLRRNCDQFDFQRLEHSTDRLDDDIEICRSRLGKLRADVPAQLAGSISLNSLFDAVYSSLNQASNDLNAALRQRDADMSGKPPLSSKIVIEPSPLFMAALSDNQPQPVIITSEQGSSPAKSSVRSGQHRFLQQDAHRFVRKMSDSHCESDLACNKINNPINQSFVTASEIEPDHDTTEALTRQLLSRLTTSEQTAVHYKNEVESLKARLDTLATTTSNEAVVTSTPKKTEPATVTVVETADVGTEMTPEKKNAIPQTAIYIQTQNTTAAETSEKTAIERADCNHHICSVSFDAAASAYKSHLSGLDRRLDTHENFVLNAFGSLLDRYVVSPKPEQQQQPQVTVPHPPPPIVAPTTLKARGVQACVSDEEEQIEIERERRAKRRASLMAKTQQKQQEENVAPVKADYEQHFEQIFSQFRTDIQDIKQSFQSTVQQQQLQTAQQLSQLQHSLAQKLVHQQQQSQPQHVAVEPPPQPPQPTTVVVEHHHRHSRSRSLSRSRHRSSNRTATELPQTPAGNNNGGDMTALSGMVHVAEETLQNLASNRVLLAEQVTQLEIKRAQLEEELLRLRDGSSQYEAQLQYLTVELASKQQELTVIDELILDARRVLSELNARTGELQTKFELLQSTAHEHGKGLEAVVARSIVAKNELAFLEEKLNSARSEMAQIERQLAERRAELQAAKEECDVVVRQREAFLADSSQVFAEHSQLTQLIVRLNAERESLISQLEAARESLLVLDTHAISKQQECDQNQRLAEDVMESVAALAVRRDSLQSEIDSLERRLTELQSSLSDFMEKGRTARLELERLNQEKIEFQRQQSSRVEITQPQLQNDQLKSLERRLAETERQLAEERCKAGQLDVVARERQDEVGRLVGQLLVVHADYLNLHRQLRRMNATFDGTDFPSYSSSLLHPTHPLLQYRESSPDLVVNSGGGVVGVGGSGNVVVGGLVMSASSKPSSSSVDRPSSSGSAASNQGGGPKQTSVSGGSQRSAESGYSSIA